MRMSFSPAASLNRQSATQVVTRTVLADGEYVYVCARALDPRGLGGMGWSPSLWLWLQKQSVAQEMTRPAHMVLETNVKPPP
jgi:hypothetical protein